MNSVEEQPTTKSLIRVGQIAVYFGPPPLPTVDLLIASSPAASAADLHSSSARPLLLCQILASR